ncbi:MAG: hypothetical protein NVS9B10_18330 [Nevskia sp.]
MLITMTRLHQCARLAGALALLASAWMFPIAARACSSCGCSVATDWTGAVDAGGLRLDARFDFVDQDQLRLGSHRSDKTPAERPTAHEYQQGTLTRYYTLGADYGFDRDWHLNLQLPYLVREHQTIGEDQDTAARSNSETRSLGDLRLVARYLGLVEDRSWGLQFGLKLPTGRHRRRFASGPLAGTVIDRGLQNGSGTTDLILGLEHRAAISRDWDRFEQLQVKQALGSADGFRPATQFTANAGLRYVSFRRVVPQLQLNLRIEGRETGAQADYANSGSQAVYLSPGLAGTLAGSLSAYGFVQLPVYQHYSGYQLAPPYLATLGLSYRF